MADEITFRTSVGGYKKDEVLEYVETMNDTIFNLKREKDTEASTYQAKIRELEALLNQETANSLQLAKQQREEFETLQAENEKLKTETKELEEKYKAANQECAKIKGEKQKLKEKLGREILRLRAENKVLAKKLDEAERNANLTADYEAVHHVVSEVQYKIAEYVNVLNKTHQNLAEAYQSMNGMKKKLAIQMEKTPEPKEE